jgi:predicted dehydrogenase
MQADIKQINLGIIGTGWCGGIPAVAAAASPWVNELHIAEIREERLKEVAELAKPATATTDYRKLIENPAIGPVMISTTPEPTHYPIAKESLLAGKHVFLEKPIALELAEADELIALAASKKLAFTIGYSRRFNPKFAYVKRSIRRWNHRRALQRASQPAHYTQFGQEDRGPGEAFSGRHASYARYRFRAVVPGSQKADPGPTSGSRRSPWLCPRTTWLSQK